MLCFRNFPLAKKFMDKRGGGGNIKIFREIYFVSQCRKFSYENPLLFRFFRDSKIFLLQRVLS